MTKETKITKNTKSKEIIKSLTKEEVKTELRLIASYDLHPDSIYEKIWTIISNIRSWSEDEKEFEYLEKYYLKLDDFSHTHSNLANTVPNKMATAIVELANNLIKEYWCETSLEKTLCEIIANSYWKIMSISKKLDWCLNFEYFWSDRNWFIWIMSKELDRANRNYLIALNNLLEIKRPQMNIKVNTKNAYFWQNQQFNNNKIKDENIKD